MGWNLSKLWQGVWTCNQTNIRWITQCFWSNPNNTQFKPKLIWDSNLLTDKTLHPENTANPDSVFNQSAFTSQAYVSRGKLLGKEAKAAFSVAARYSDPSGSTSTTQRALESSDPGTDRSKTKVRLGAQGEGRTRVVQHLVRARLYAWCF